MDTALVKFLILWIICENILSSTSMALKGIANEDANTRQKRSPASLFGFNLGNPISTAKDTLSNIGNIFSGNRGNHHNNYQEQKDVGGPYVRNTNTLPPAEFPSGSGISNSMIHNNLEKGDKYTRPQENKNEVSKNTVPERNDQNQNSYQEKQAPENPGNYQSNADVDKQLLEYIFQNQKFYNDPAGTTVDNSIDFVTETGDFETTTDLGFNRMLPPAAVASLLG